MVPNPAGWSRRRRGKQRPYKVSGVFMQFLGVGRGRTSMVCSDARFKAGLKSISYGNALFTLIILYQVGVTSCSAEERVGEKGCGDGQVVA